MPTLPVLPGLAIDADELRETFIRASGPGGQNVNKVSTAVELRFDAGRSPSLPQPVRDRLLRIASHLATQNGEIVIRAERFRTQARNREDARERLFALIAEAAIPPRPRIATRPGRAVREERLKAKKARAGVKAMRGRVSGD